MTSLQLTRIDWKSVVDYVKKELSWFITLNNFDMIIGWGRMALLIDYNSDNETIKLRDDFLNIKSI